MSDRLYWRLLRWNRGTGIARLRDVVVTLTEAPDLGDGPVAELDYSPDVKCYEIRRQSYEARGDMTRIEIDAACRLLIELTRIDSG